VEKVNDNLGHVKRRMLNSYEEAPGFTLASGIMRGDALTLSSTPEPKHKEGF